MYVKSMVIDGFKSYGQRVDVNGFDPLFNAITGLNGSGKSNILDAICFVLGISNLSQVRAKDLQDLVYKNGQAGVVKATVSITFDNKDKTQSPVGYDHYDEISVTRQVVVGGKNKYLINGCNAQNSRVQDLFRSVQLNVNNPHFLIMQGRITKVLNMKPPEILSMIEEAAGTKMYETKKQSAQKTIEKKDAKLKEIDSILSEDITPTLSKLKEERASYLEYQKVQRELEYLNKLVVAYQYASAQESAEDAKLSIDTLKQEVRILQETICKDKQSVKDLENQIEQMLKKKSLEEDGKLKQFDADLKEAQAKEAKASSALSSNKENIKTEQKKKKELQKNQDEDTAALSSKERELQESTGLLTEFQERCQQDLDSLRQAQDRFQAVSAGLSSNEDGAEATLADQLMAAKSEIATADTEKKQAEMQLKQSRADLNTKKKELHTTEKEYNVEQAALKKLQQELAKLEGEMSKIQYNEDEAEALLNRRRTLAGEVSALTERLEFLQSRNPNLIFDYKSPEPNFDRRKVLGVMASLVSVKDMSTATALEMVAGGKLYNVVVDTEETGKKLLNSGNLKRRVTFIPLNKITGPTIPRDVVAKAERLVGKENVSPAINLVNIPPRLESAMQFVFGNAFVCPNMDSAKKVAFQEGIQRKTVTLDGESFDPSGTLSGGSRQSAPVLPQAAEVHKVKAELEEKQAELEVIDQRMKNMQNAAGKFRQIKQQLMLKQHEAELLQNKVQQSRHQQQLEEVEALQKAIESYEEALVRCEEVRKKCTSKAKELESKLKNVQATREQELKAAEKQVTACKKKSEQSSKLLKEKQKNADTLKLEMEDLQKALATYAEQMNTIDSALQAYQEKATILTDVLEKAKGKVSQAQTEVQQQKDLLKAKNQEIQEHVKRKDDLEKAVHDGEFKLKEREHTHSKLTTTARESAERVKYLLSHHDWIADDSKYFGQPNTAYDFQANDPVEARRRLEKLQETKDKLGKKVNMRAMNMLGKAEEQYNDLLHKKKIVEGDKKKIADVIRELDEKKKEALMAAWAQVNKDFGSIFSMLLPGTQAKLDPPENQTVLDGLEVRVAFGNVWKESLGELSGGQRSLVALSLILAMLLFKPAPIYILDEVDAALDLSHTQNIGQMLRTHFQHSQFIVVSLKDGMFNNANVLFKTKFVDGTSTVSRFEQRQTSKGK